MRGRPFRCGHAALGVFAVLISLFGLALSASPKQDGSILEKRVASFRVAGLPALDAVLDLAQREQIPLGIEYVSREAVEAPVTLEMQSPTVGEVLEALFPQKHSYRWSAEEGVVVITHTRIPQGGQNVLNRIIPEFSVERASLQSANVALNMTLLPLVFTIPKPYGFVGTGEGGNPKNLVGPLKMKKVTVRTVLNQLVRQNRNAAWVVTVRPENMGRFDFPRHWRILEYESPPRRWAQLLKRSLFGEPSCAPDKTPE